MSNVFPTNPYPITHRTIPTARYLDLPLSIISVIYTLNYNNLRGVYKSFVFSIESVIITDPYSTIYRSAIYGYTGFRSMLLSPGVRGYALGSKHWVYKRLYSIES